MLFWCTLEQEGLTFIATVETELVPRSLFKHLDAAQRNTTVRGRGRRNTWWVTSMTSACPDGTVEYFTTTDPVPSDGFYWHPSRYYPLPNVGIYPRPPIRTSVLISAQDISFSSRVYGVEDIELPSLDRVCLEHAWALQRKAARATARALRRKVLLSNKKTH